MNPTDEELISAFQNGDEQAFDRLFQRYKMPIFNFSLRLSGNRAESEDIVSEVFLKLYTRRHAYKPVARFSTWLFTVARNEAISRMRISGRTTSLWFRRAGQDQAECRDVPDQAPSARDRIMEEESAQSVSAAVRRLPADQKEALVLREYHAMCYDDIAAVMGCSRENVKILIFRARCRLREELPALLKEGHDD